MVPFAAGGGTDAIGRVIAEKLSARLGQPVVVENKAGAASAIGTAYVAKAAPDGYTLLMTTNSAMVILPLTQPAGSLNYDRSDFSMIGLTGILPNLLIVSPKVPANSVSELIAYAKARPGQLSFASSGNGTITHLIGELFKARTGIDVVHVPYRTGVQSAPDVMEGRVQYIFDNIIWSLPMIRAGQAERSRHHHQPALGARARHPDRRGIRRARLRGHHLAWPCRARENAGADRPASRRRASRRPRRAGRYQQARGNRRRAADRAGPGRHASDCLTRTSPAGKASSATERSSCNELP